MTTAGPSNSVVSTPDTLAGLMDQAVQQRLARCNHILPGSVVAYNPALQTVHVQPAIQGRYWNEDLDTAIPYPLPVVPNCPVLWPGCAAGGETWPLVVGDTVLLLVADRSTDEWRAVGGSGIIPQDLRRFDLSDGFALPIRLPGRTAATGYGAGGVIEGNLQLGSSAAVSPVVLSTFLAAFGVAGGPITELIALYTAIFGVPPPQLTALQLSIQAGGYQATLVRAI